MAPASLPAPVPSAGRVEVVWARPHRSARLTGILDAAEMRRLGSLREVADQARYVAGHALLRILAARHWSIAAAEVALGLTCGRCGGAHGRPVAVPPNGCALLHLSLAHSGDRVVAAATELGPVGVDVEPIDAGGFAAFDEVALTGNERAAIRLLAPGEADGARTTVWVRKESVLKATGDGLALDPRLVEVSPSCDPPRLLRWAAGPASPRAQLYDLDVGHGYVACLTLLADRPAAVPVRCADNWLRGDG